MVKIMANTPLRNGILSFIIPGLGQILNGEQKKAIYMFVIFLIMNLFAYFLLNNPLGHVINIAYHGYCGYDAFKFCE